MSPFDVILLLSFVFLCFYLVFASNKSSKAKGPQLPPGPKGWPILGNLPQLGSKPHHAILAMSKTYGPLLHLRFGSNEMVIASSPTVVGEFLRTNDTSFSDRPRSSTAEHMAYNYHNMVHCPYGQEWRMLRKVSAQNLLGSKALDDLKHLREEELLILVRMLHSRASSDGEKAALVSLGSEVHMCSTNALSRAMIGHRLFPGVEENIEERRLAVEFREMMEEVMRLASPLAAIGDLIPSLRWLDIGGAVKNMKRLHDQSDVLVDKLIAECHAAIKAEREQGGGDGGGGRKQDLLSALVRCKEDGDGITDTNIKGMLMDMFVAGTETISGTIEWALSELIRHPDVLKKAQQEIDSIVGRDRLVSESDIPNLPFLQAVVKENFRLHPLAPFSLPRLASNECIIGGYKIPKGATLLVNIWGMGRDPKTWTDPFEFRPARFLPGGEGAHVDAKGNNFELIPFGAGRRICPGTGYGLLSVQSIVATLIHAFDWTLPAGITAETLDMDDVFGITLQKAVRLMAHPIPRLAQKAYGIKGE